MAEKDQVLSDRKPTKVWDNAGLASNLLLVAVVILFVIALVVPSVREFIQRLPEGANYIHG